MRNFDYSKTAKDFLSNDVVNLISTIHEYKGQQNLFIESKAEILTNLLEVAKIQSAGASNRIEGIYTSDKRMAELVKDKSEPRNRDESEIAGYRDVLATIHENYDYMPPSPNLILQLHRDLYKFSPSSLNGRFKNSDNIIEEIDEKGNRFMRFKPLSAFETPMAMEEICKTFMQETEKSEIDPLILIPVFILDFLCIHPFNDGNGRMSRLLTLLLLYRAGYIVGKYISIEMLIEKSKRSYYDVLSASSKNWHTDKNNIKPFVIYYLGVILNAYKEFSTRVEYLTTKNISKPERIETILKNRLGRITMSELQDLCPDISYSTITKTLTSLMKSGKLKKIGGGRYSAYINNREKHKE
ncbi:MAG: Fic family protein [Clostridia bacterium]|jgi:Fic family protein